MSGLSHYGPLAGGGGETELRDDTRASVHYNAGVDGMQKRSPLKTVFSAERAGRGAGRLDIPIVPVLFAPSGKYGFFPY